MAANEDKDDIQSEGKGADEETTSGSDTGSKATSTKKKKRAADQEAGPSKDRNKRVREQAQRKMEEAKERAKSRANRIGATGLDTGEMMDDALARGFAAFTRWVKNNRRSIEFSIGGLILAGAGYALWDWYSTEKREESTAMLMTATNSTLGVVTTEEDKLDPEEAERLKDIDPRPRFESYKAKREKALEAYRATAADYGGTGAGILARLGEAGVLLDRGDYDGAIRALEAVLATDLAKADETVRMNAKERMGMALEGKGDEAAAMAAYEEVAGSSLDYYKNLGMYHQARLALAKGKKDEAKEKLSKLRERLKGTDTLKSTMGDRFLTTQVDALIREVDPTAAPLTGGGEITPEKLRELQEQLEKMRKNAPDLTERPAAPKPTDSDEPPATSATPGGSAPPPGSPPAAPNTPDENKKDENKKDENKKDDKGEPKDEKKEAPTPPAPPASAGGN
ncbi:MAG: hypothetical protein ACOC1F_02235 [Myxococcota bacterium]